MKQVFMQINYLETALFEMFYALWFLKMCCAHKICHSCDCSAQRQLRRLFFMRCGHKICHSLCLFCSETVAAAIILEQHLI